MHFDDDGTGRLLLRDESGATEDHSILAEYIYAPTEPQLESPRPYALLRTRGGADAGAGVGAGVTAYRPDDHVWHKGLSLALPVVGTHNFWGGPTYVHGDGYVQLPNNGAQVHRSFAASDTPVADAAAGLARIDERLDWVAEGGEVVLVEHRTLTARAIDDRSWALTWRSALRNVRDEPLGFGSPTSKGRENAGYAGIFWRGPTAFTGGEIIAPVGGVGGGGAGAVGAPGAVGDDARGEPGPWLAFIAPDHSAGVLMLDAADPVTDAGNPWFARSAEYAGLNPAPFFYRETVLPAGETLVLSAVVIIGGPDVADHAAVTGANLVAELRADSSFATPEEPA